MKVSCQGKPRGFQYCQWSPGMFIVAELIREAIQGGIEAIDFLRSHEPVNTGSEPKDKKIYRIIING